MLTQFYGQRKEQEKALQQQQHSLFSQASWGRQQEKAF